MSNSRIRCPAAVFLLAALSFAVGAQGAGGGFEDAQGWAETFDSPRRDAWQMPDRVIAVLAPAPDARVADIGAGTGYFAVRLARALPRGRIYAVDVEPAMVAHLAQRARDQGLANLSAHQASRTDPGLPEAVDLVLMVNVQGLVVNPGDYFARLRARLRPGGRIALIAARPGDTPGPPEHMRAPAEQVVAAMRGQGYTLVASHDFLPRQYLLVFALDR